MYVHHLHHHRGSKLSVLSSHYWCMHLKKTVCTHIHITYIYACCYCCYLTHIQHTTSIAIWIVVFIVPRRRSDPPCIARNNFVYYGKVKVHFGVACLPLPVLVIIIRCNPTIWWILQQNCPYTETRRRQDKTREESQRTKSKTKVAENLSAQSSSFVCLKSIGSQHKNQIEKWHVHTSATLTIEH